MKKNSCIRLDADAKQIIACRDVVGDLENSFESLSNILSLTGNSVRLKILYLLHREQHLCVCDLSDILKMNVSAVSQHLRKLKDRNLIYSRKEGQTIFYTINESQMHILLPFFEILDSSKVISEMV